jgi:hypothetical protein
LKKVFGKKKTFPQYLKQIFFPNQSLSPNPKKKLLLRVVRVLGSHPQKNRRFWEAWKRERSQNLWVISKTRALVHHSKCKRKKKTQLIKIASF